MINKQDKEILQKLADKYMSYAALPVNKEKIKLWKSLNALNMQRPMVLIDQLPWHELDVDGSLKMQVSDPYWRKVEKNLRQQIYKWEHMPADMVLDPVIFIPKVIERSGYGIGITQNIAVTDSANDITSHQYTNILTGYEDLEKIQKDAFVLDKEATKQKEDEAKNIFDGIAPVKSQGVGYHLGIWDFISMYMSISDIYFELADRPEFLHAIMEKFTDSILHAIKTINEQGIYNSDCTLCHCSHTFNDKLKIDSDFQTTNDGWAYGMAQLFSSCSPEITKEFEVKYMKKIFKHFGYIYYGCCEKLDDRIDVLRELPNVLKISCSPWSDRYNFAAQVAGDYVMSNKPNPAFVATDAFDIEGIKKDLRETKKAAKQSGTNLEFILKDVSTCAYKPQRLWEWSNAALEVCME